MREDEWNILPTDDVETLKALTNVLINMRRLKRLQKYFLYGPYHRLGVI
ncbi:hypothetical protein BDFB_013275 [Asbolus verrucosus]|uniref:Uncharacterized protein n=1 Tax=Asbolus verrucosus TaxID=1661398 RepID=A0A482VKZ8_ASBVE|nr:hypothetical protein BDFB_013275 [Asbolus verrucosus]